MKIILRFIMGLTITFFASNSFAEMNRKECPSVSTIANTKFLTAAPASAGWRLNHKIGYWTVIFIVNHLDGANTAMQAIKIGQEYFDSKVNLENPDTMGLDGICVYAMTNEYTVFTLNIRDTRNN